MSEIANQDSVVTKPGFCALCRSRCGTVSTVKDGNLIEIAPDPDHPTGGAMCRKGRSGPEMVHNPRRLTRPLRRTNPKGAANPGWVEISWEEALDLTATHMRKVMTESGPEAIAFGVTTPAGTAMSDSIEWVERFIRLLGSPNICYATEICKWHQDYAHKFTFGVGIPTPDFKNSDLMILWGYNPSRTWLSQASRISDAQRRGAELIVVDPRCTGHAQQADHWLRVRPGSDGILALALAHVLIEEEKYDRDFVHSWTNSPFLVREDTGRFLRTSDLRADASGATAYLGWSTQSDEVIAISSGESRSRASGTLALHGRFPVDTHEGTVWCRPAFDLYARSCAQFAPERAEELTWVPAETIRAAARAIAAANRVSYYAWTGVGQSVTATQTERAIALLYALTGSFDAPGGNVCFSKLPANRVNELELLSRPQRDKALGFADRPLGPPSQGWITADDLYTSIIDGEPYRVRALFAFGGNMLLSQADSRRGKQALESCEFHVHCDLVETPTSQLADIVLPVATPWEREALRVGFDIDELGEELVQFRQKVVEPVGEARSDTWIVFELAKRLGLAENFFGGEIEAGWNHILQPLGISVDVLRERPEGIRIPLQHQYRKYAMRQGAGFRGFNTPTGRVEVYSELLLGCGYEPVPGFETLATEFAGNTDDYPLVLTSAKNGYFCHTEHRNIASLRKRSMEPGVEISTELAESLAISVGEWVHVETESGRARFKAKLNGDIHHNVVVGEYGWWQACDDLGLPAYDPFSDDGSNLNNVISAKRGDPISGSVPLRSFPCRIRKIHEPERAKPWSGFLPFEVIELTKETARTTSVTLRPLDGRRLPGYRPGQHLSMRIPARNGAPVATRSYSLSGQALTKSVDAYRITVQSTGDNSFAAAAHSVSAYINQKLAVGDTLEVQAPAGLFLLPVTPDLPVVLVAAGIGITPFIGYLEAVVARAGGGAGIHLFYGNRNSRSHAFRKRLQELGAFRRIRVVNFYSRPLPEERPGTDYDAAGRIDAGVVDEALIERRARFYLCGPEGMTADLMAGLERRGVPRFDIFYEIFNAQSVKSRSEGPHRIRFARSDLTLVWSPADGTLLEHAEAAGLQLASGCRVGQCESCALKIVSGSIRHLNRPELDEEDYGLVCQAVPASDLVFDA